LVYIFALFGCFIFEKHLNFLRHNRARLLNIDLDVYNTDADILIIVHNKTINEYVSFYTV